jgi:hypothetical protein
LQDLHQHDIDLSVQMWLVLTNTLLILFQSVILYVVNHDIQVFLYGVIKSRNRLIEYYISDDALVYLIQDIRGYQFYALL